MTVEEDSDDRVAQAAEQPCTQQQSEANSIMHKLNCHCSSGTPMPEQ